MKDIELLREKSVEKSDSVDQLSEKKINTKPIKKESIQEKDSPKQKEIKDKLNNNKKGALDKLDSF